MAMFLLVAGVFRRSLTLFVASLVVLAVSCVVALVAFSSLAAFPFVGSFIITFGVACELLSSRQRSAKPISRSSLSTIGWIFIAVGIIGVLII
jgi:hypothetical protein